MAKKILHNPAEINIAISKPNEKITQLAYVVYEAQKIPLVKFILHQKEFSSVLVFCSSKQAVKQLTRELKRTKLAVDEIHSDLEQDKREEVLMYFKSGRLKVLIATDILSRGIDIDNIGLVINYDVPHDGEDYVHRIGRTARAAAEGTAITFISEKEQRKFQSIERLLGKEVPKEKIPEQFGEGQEYRKGHHSHPNNGRGHQNGKRPGNFSRNRPAGR